MGVHGLTGLIAKHAPNAIRVISANTLARQTIAFDASCHLNKFIYGDEPHNYKHIYGFYQLARFCDLNQIRPIFVFDGPKRLAAKSFELAKRAKARSKVKHSLAFEKEQSIRLDNWLQFSNSIDNVDQFDKINLASIFNDLDQTMADAENRISNNNAVMKEVEDIVDERNYKAADIDIEGKLMLFAQELRNAITNSKNTEKYTRTVRALVYREKELIADMVSQEYKNTKSALKRLRRDNQVMLDSLQKRSFRITQAIREECRDFLEALGYLCFTCNGHEAEAMCAHLGRAGITKATVSEDLDTLVFGEVPILRYFFARHRPILSIDPVVARQELGLSKDAFIDLCILCGTDFSGTIQGIGPHRAIQAIQKYGSIEMILQHMDSKRYVPHETFNYQRARNVFNSLPPIPLDRAAYQPPKLNESRKAELLKHYELDALTIEVKLKASLLQQNLIDGHSLQTQDPFAPNASQLSLNAF
ncbi:PIN domain-like protein [Mycotypha africana]|uniref:PIN domain-like protein n=1 Tax=Mycotypha africana TaxID=64632 RepID=UPI0023007E6C|nr:PIN domain-like protein [Mycotypha africana]KAI8968309.1 PIN domain-like protein [Mycotypha africana]